MQVNRYINGKKAQPFAGMVVENEAVKEAIAAARRRMKETEETT